MQRFQRRSLCKLESVLLFSDPTPQKVEEVEFLSSFVRFRLAFAEANQMPMRCIKTDTHVLYMKNKSPDRARTNNHPSSRGYE